MNTQKDLINQIIEKAKKGEQSAFNYLLNTFWLYVYQFQLKKISNDEDAEDITIQTFSKAFDKIHLFNNQYEFKTWLISISKNVYIDFLRKKKSIVKTCHQEFDESFHVIDETPSPEDKIITEQNLNKLLRDIKKLKPKYQEVINLRFFQELSYKEIAEINGESLNNTKVKLLRAKKLLSEIIKNS